ncbi:MAG: DUF2723 domain-containing protein [Chloroflexi bacterium]|nr:DUF2723 domain-containing protein [Chloroflexota bacterium]
MPLARVDAPARATPWLAKHAAAVGGGCLAAACLALYVATRSPWLDDWDSYNFARALSHFDVRLNQPQPPGYPLYVLLGRAVNLFAHDPQVALTLLSALAGAGAVLAFYALAADMGVPWAAVPLAVMPLFWLSAGMALSDVPGLCLSTVSVWLLAREPQSHRRVIGGCFTAGLAAGVRPQDAVVPLAVLVLYAAPRVRAWHWLAGGVGAGVAACLLWAVPLVVSLGGVGGAVQAMLGQGQYVGGTDSLLARPLTWGNLGERVGEFGSVFAAYLGRPGSGGLAAMLALLGAAVVLALLPRGRLAHLALVWLAPYLILMMLAFRPDDPRKILPAIPPLLLLLAGALRRWPVASAVACTGLVAFFAANGLPLIRELDTEPPAPNQAAAYISAQGIPAESVVVAGASYNAVHYLLPNVHAYLVDDLDTAALNRDLASAKHLFVLDKEGFSPPATWLATDTQTFQRDSLVLPKASQVWLEAYEPLPGGPASLTLPAGGQIHIGSSDDIAYLIGGWDRPEVIAGVPARWTDTEAEVRFYVDQPAAETLTLVGVAYPDNQRLTVSVNGQPAARLSMVKDWAPYTIPLPASALKAQAVNTITLVHSLAVSAFDATGGQSLDRRPLAAAYQLVGITPA